MRKKGEKSLCGLACVQIPQFMKYHTHNHLGIYRLIHWVHTTFKLVYGHLNGIYLTGNFVWAYSRHFANSGQEDRAKCLQVNKHLLKLAMFCCTLCGGQNLEILPDPFGHCLQNVWSRPTQNYWSKRCRLGDPIPIWMWYELSESYGIQWLHLISLLDVTITRNK